MSRIHPTVLSDWCPVQFTDHGTLVQESCGPPKHKKLYVIFLANPISKGRTLYKVKESNNSPGEARRAIEFGLRFSSQGKVGADPPPPHPSPPSPTGNIMDNNFLVMAKGQ